MVTCQIKQLENVNLKGLVDHLCKKKLMDNIDVELKALNIISWKNINDETVFQGGLSGKKFYPESLVKRNIESKEMERNLFLMSTPLLSPFTTP
jgi:hypothetical protein